MSRYMAETVLDFCIGAVFASFVWAIVLDARSYCIRNDIYKNHTFRVIVEKDDHSRAVLDISSLNEIPDKHNKIVGRYFVEYREFSKK